MSEQERRAVIKAALDCNPTPLMANGLEPDDVIVRFATEGDTPGWSEANMVAVVRTPDDQFIALEGWCDYTGWDCQSGLDVAAFVTLDEALSIGLTADGRAMLARADLPPDVARSRVPGGDGGGDRG